MKIKNDRWLTLGSVVGPILFTLTWPVLGMLRPGYSNVSRPISALGIGSNGIYMDAAFIITGLLLVTGVVAGFHTFWKELSKIARWFGIILFLLPPIGLLWAGIFSMNFLALHTIGAMVACGLPIITFPIVGLVLRRVPNWRRFGAWMATLGCLLTLVLNVVFSTSVPQSEMVTGGGNFGLWQRALIIEVFAWYAAFGWQAFRTTIAIQSRSRDTLDGRNVGGNIERGVLSHPPTAPLASGRGEGNF